MSAAPDLDQLANQLATAAQRITGARKALATGGLGAATPQQIEQARAAGEGVRVAAERLVAALARMVEEQNAA
jgi:hypothetical protein